MDAPQKQLLRAVVRRVHPDLFVGLPLEREQNSESLKVHAHADLPAYRLIRKYLW